MDNCIFCKIIKKEIPSSIEKETANLMVFKDINPKAPIHVLIVPKKHIQDMRRIDSKLWSEIRDLILELGKGLEGFRIVHNVGKAAAVPHMHIHFLGNITQEREV